MTWDNAVLVSRKTARELGVQNGDLVEITLNGRSVTGPIWVQPGMADYSLGLALGYGRERAGRVGSGVGFNAYTLFTGKIYRDRRDGSQDGRDARACLHAESLVHGRPAGRARGEPGANSRSIRTSPRKCTSKEPPVVAPLYPNPLDAGEEDGAAPVGHVD